MSIVALCWQNSECPGYRDNRRCDRSVGYADVRAVVRLRARAPENGLSLESRAIPVRQIRSLLYHEGYTIKGVQRLMREGALKERVEALEGDTIDLSQLGEAERRRREIAIAIGQLNALRDRLLALLEP